MDPRGEWPQRRAGYAPLGDAVKNQYGISSQLGRGINIIHGIIWSFCRIFGRLHD